MYNSLIIIFLSALAVFARPLKRCTAADVQVLAFANVLEQLESAFYTQALTRFNASDFGMAGFTSSQIPIQQIKTIAGDEKIHAITLQSSIYALGGQVISNCTFNFSSAFTNVNTMVATARMVENIGVGAYLGALTSLTDLALVTTASSILTVEARHQTILNLLSNASSIPQPFDVALTPPDVLAIANTFISGCQLGFAANPPLTVTNKGTLQAGMKLNFNSPALNGTVPENQLSCKIVTGGLHASLYQPMNSCVLPANVTGPVYVFITDHRQPQIAIKSPSNMNGTTNSSLVVAGPALLFINQSDFIGSLIRPGLNGTGTTTESHAVSTSPHFRTASLMTATTSAHPVPLAASIPSLGAFTTTISPAQASALMSSLMA